MDSYRFHIQVGHTPYQGCTAEFSLPHVTTLLSQSLTSWRGSPLLSVFFWEKLVFSTAVLCSYSLKGPGDREGIEDGWRTVTVLSALPSCQHNEVPWYLLRKLQSLCDQLTPK